MTTTRPVLRIAIAAAALAAAAPVPAATYLVPGDDALIHQAGLIVRGRVLDSTSLRAPGGGIVTDTRIAVSATLKGADPGPIVSIRRLGGELDGMIEVYPGTGDFGPNEDVLLLLEPRSAEPPRVLHFALGKFHIGQTVDGQEYALRDGLGVQAALTGGTHIERVRALSRFERYIADLAAGEIAVAAGLSAPPAPAADYFRDSWTPKISVSAGFEYLATSAGFARWQEFDALSTVTYKDNPAGATGCSGGCHSETSFGVTAWNADLGSNVNMVYGGTSGTIGSTCLSNLDDEINYEDPCNDITDLVSCGGTLALGGFSATTSPTSQGCVAKQASPWIKIVDGHVMVNNGVGSCLNSCNFQTMMTHEVGHSIGFGHSADTTALMAPSLKIGICGVLQSDDIAGVACIYPQGICNPTDITSVIVAEKNPTKVKLTLNGTAFAKGDVVQIDAGAGFVDVVGAKVKAPLSIKIKKAAPYFPDGSTVTIRILNGCGATGNELQASR